MRTHYHLGNYLIEGDYYNSLPAAQQIQERNRGISELKKSIDPNHARSNYFIGQILQISSKPEVQSRAQHYLDKAMLLDPKYAQ